MKTKMQKFKTWAKDYSEEIVLGTVATAVGAAYITYFVHIAKQANIQLAAENEEWNARVEYEMEIDKMLIDEHNSGKSIYALLDGTYLTVPNDADRKLIK